MLVKNHNFGQKLQFWSKVTILIKNNNFGQKLQFWSKITILVKNFSLNVSVVSLLYTLEKQRENEWQMDVKNSDFSFRMQWDTELRQSTVENFIKVDRYNGGSGGQGQGKVISKITNKFNTAKTILTLEVIPWWLIPEIGKITFRNCEKVHKVYIPADDQMRKTASLSMMVYIPAGAECWIDYDYTTAWPKWTEYPPDANHGRYLPAVMVFYSDAETTRQTFSGTFKFLEFFF